MREEIPKDEMVIIVDKDDNILRYEKRVEEMNHGDLHRASSLWIKNSNGKSLLARRSPRRMYEPDAWGPAVGGTLTKGDTYRSCIIRETEEEIGIENINPKEDKKTLTEDYNPHFTQWFTLTLNKDAKDFKLQEEEVAEVRWFSEEEFLEEIKGHDCGLHERMKKNFKYFG